MSLPSGNDFRRNDNFLDVNIKGNRIWLGGGQKVSMRSGGENGLDLTDTLMYSSLIPVDADGDITNVIGLDGNGKWYKTAKGGASGDGGDVFTGGNPLTPSKNIYVDGVLNWFKGIVAVNSNTPTATSAWTYLLVIEPDSVDATQFNVSKISELPQSKVTDLVSDLATNTTNIATNTTNIATNTAAIVNCAKLNVSNTYVAGIFNHYNGEIKYTNLASGSEEVLGIDQYGVLKVHSSESAGYVLLNSLGGSAPGGVNPPQTLLGWNMFYNSAGPTFFINRLSAGSIEQAISILSADELINSGHQEITLGNLNNTLSGGTVHQAQLDISHPIKIHISTTNGTFKNYDNVSMNHAIEVRYELGDEHFPGIVFRSSLLGADKQYGGIELWRDGVSKAYVYNVNESIDTYVPQTVWQIKNADTTNVGIAGFIDLLTLDPQFGLILDSREWTMGSASGVPVAMLELKQTTITQSYLGGDPMIKMTTEDGAGTTLVTSAEFSFFQKEDCIKLNKDLLVEQPTSNSQTKLIISCNSSHVDNQPPDNPRPIIVFRIRNHCAPATIYDEHLELTSSQYTPGQNGSKAGRFLFSSTIATFNTKVRSTGTSDGITGNHIGQTLGDKLHYWSAPSTSPPTTISTAGYSNEIVMSCNSASLLSAGTPEGNYNPGNGHTPGAPLPNATFRQWGWSIQTSMGTGGANFDCTKHLLLWCNSVVKNEYYECQGLDRVGVGYFETNAPNNKFNFTGSHHCIGIAPSPNKTLYQDSMIGKVVISTGTIKPLLKRGIDDACPEVIICQKEKDKRVIGVVKGYEKDGEPRVDNGATSWRGLLAKDQNRVIINALGEGLVWVSNNGENCENGDYITSSARDGYAQKQDDDLMHNYTIGKLTEDIIWGERTEYLAACIYYCG